MPTVVRCSTPPNMRIGIDASALEKPRPTGVERYVHRLLAAMMTLPLQSGEEIVLYGHGEKPSSLALPAGWVWKRLAWGYPGWTHLRLSAELLRNAPDVFFMPAHEVPLFTGRAKVVTTVHDIVFAEAPSTYPFAQRVRQSLAVRHAIAAATTLLCVSEATKDALRRVYGVAPERCVVTYNAPDLQAQPVIDETVTERLALTPYRYFMFVSRVEAKKDPATAVRAFAKVHKAQPDTRLVLVGSPGYGYDAVERALAEEGVADAVVRPGYLSDAERDALLKNPAALLFPSRGEGFGLPALEALAFGTPVILSDIPVFHEVAGDVGRYAPVGEPQIWAQVMQSVLDDEAWRAHVAVAGPQRAAMFDWNGTAHRTLDALRAAYA